MKAKLVKACFIVTSILLLSVVIFASAEKTFAEETLALDTPIIYYPNGGNVKGDRICFEWSYDLYASAYFFRLYHGSNLAFNDLVKYAWNGNNFETCFTNFPDNGDTFSWQVRAHENIWEEEKMGSSLAISHFYLIR